MAGIATIIPAASAIGFSAWGRAMAGAPVSLLGSVTLIIASIIEVSGRKSGEAALLALGGALAAWSFYLPVDVYLARAWASDRQLELTVAQWQEFGSSLSVAHQGPEFQFSSDELRELRAAGIKGRVSVYMARSEYGRGKKGSALILIQAPVRGPILLKEPDASNIVYFQAGGAWKKYPEDAPTLDRAITLSPWSGDPRTTQVLVELATGGQIGFGVWWPKSDARRPE